jgi:hypothetical protein
MNLRYEKYKDYYKEYRANHKDAQKEYVKNNKTRIQLKNCEWRKKNPQRSWVLKTKSGHKVAGYQFLFSDDELINLAKNTKHCFICGIPLDWTGAKGKLNKSSPSLDRKDGKIILSLNDIQIICFECNRTKGNRTMEEFISYCENVCARRSI